MKTKSKNSGKKRVTFTLESEVGKKIYVAGDFNNWTDEDKELLDKADNGIYRKIMLLSPGRYEYKFIIDGVWCIDPANPSFTKNAMNTLNSVIEV